MMCSCGNTTPKNQSAIDSSNKDDSQVAVPAAKGRYAIKSGIVVLKGKFMGMDAEQTAYFNDSGALEAIYLSMELMGNKSTSITVTKDNYAYNFNPDNKTGIDFENLNEKVIKDYNIKKEGSENLLGKECDKYSMSNPPSMKGNYLVWKGITLKMDVDISTIKMIFEATSVQENVDVPAEKFVIPADIVFH